MLNVKALQQQSALETFFDGNVAIAQAMSPGEDLANVMFSRELTICEDCSSKDVRIAELAIEDE